MKKIKKKDFVPCEERIDRMNEEEIMQSLRSNKDIIVCPQINPINWIDIKTGKIIKPRKD